jgi:hypothetical protein
MSIHSIIRNRLIWGIFCGLAIGHLTGGPSDALAQARTSLGSLQAQVDALTSSVTSLQSTVVSLQTSQVSQATFATFKSSLAASGTINNASNPVDWSQLKNVPPGIADGVDDGIPSSGGVFTGSVQIGGNLSVSGVISGNGSGLTNVP